MEKLFTRKSKIKSLALLIASVVLVVFTSCHANEKKKIVPLDRVHLPVMKAYDVNTVISDSGITRFRITAPVWYYYVKVEKPYWNFPKGLHFEKFDEKLAVYAKIDADSAVYYLDNQEWVLSGHVKSMNLQGEYFETEKLYIEQNEDRIHTDKFIKITQKSRIITGVGFESNQRLTRYTIQHPQGFFPL